jgi:hypothetical protein
MKFDILSSESCSNVITKSVLDSLSVAILQIILMFAPCINSIKALFIIPTDAHYYKITGILKQLKFRLSLRHVSVHA